MFKGQVGRNMEVYVNDLLIKSSDPELHLDDLQETFVVLWWYRMKLTLLKCAFGVESGKFLGFMVSECGVEANPEKIDAILNMHPCIILMVSKSW